MVFLFVQLLLLVVSVGSLENGCSPIYVRWPRVRLNLTSRVTGPYSLEDCASYCSKDEHPARAGYPLQCSGFNHKHGASSVTNDCQLFQKDQVALLDGNVEYDDRYSFYWKYCIKGEESCKSTYHYDFYTDRYMEYNESQRRISTSQLEECLQECLAEKSFQCRSVSFNRTAGYCYLSKESRLSKPTSVRVNGNPNYRIDYYENKCHNDSFTFHHECQSNGVLVSVESKFPYTGAMYGLYDFFSCRVEPKEETNFHYFFPFAAISKNCSDSMTIRDGEYVLEVVLSTDNVVPLYFLTDEDTIYKVKCAADSKLHSASTIAAQVELVPPLKKNELDSKIGPDTWTSRPFSSSAASLSFTGDSTDAHSTPSTFSTTVNTSTTTTVNIVSVGSTSTEPTNPPKAPSPSSPDVPVKKLPESLPSIDTKPDSAQERKGNKITLLLRYPHVNESGYGDQDNETDEVINSTSSNEYSSFTGDVNASTVAGARETASSVPAGSTGTTNLDGSASAVLEYSTTTPTIESSSNITASEVSSANSTSDQPDFIADPFITSPTVYGSTDANGFAPSSASAAEIISSISPSTPIAVTTPVASTLEPAPPLSSEEDEELNIVPILYSPPPSPPNPHNWLNVWFASTPSSATASPSTHTSARALSEVTVRPRTRTLFEITVRPDTALNIDSNYSPIKRIDPPRNYYATETTTKTQSYETSTSSSGPETTSSSSIRVSSSNTIRVSSGSNTGRAFPTSTSSIEATITSSSPETSTSTTVSNSISAASTTNTTLVNDTTSDASSTFQPFIIRSTTSTSSTSTFDQVSSSLVGSSTPSLTASLENTTILSTSTENTANTRLGDSLNETSVNGTTPGPFSDTTTNGPPKKIQFDVHHNGQPVSAVVVGSRIILTFVPTLSVPGTYMSLIGCQVEPVNSPYAWERDPLQIVKNGCQADGVGLVCPPAYTDDGVKVEMEAFRYTTTGEVLYSCLIRICPYGPCPQPPCNDVDGCTPPRRPAGVTLSAFPHPAFSIGKRRKRQQSTIPVLSFLPINTDLQQHLATLAGDHVVTKKLTVVNSEADLEYYLKTGNVPTGNHPNSFLGG